MKGTGRFEDGDHGVFGEQYSLVAKRNCITAEQRACEVIPNSIPGGREGKGSYSYTNDIEFLEKGSAKCGF